MQRSFPLYQKNEARVSKELHLMKKKKNAPCTPCPKVPFLCSDINNVNPNWHFRDHLSIHVFIRNKGHNYDQSIDRHVVTVRQPLCSNIWRGPLQSVCIQMQTKALSITTIQLFPITVHAITGVLPNWKGGRELNLRPFRLEKRCKLTHRPKHSVYMQQ